MIIKLSTDIGPVYMEATYAAPGLAVHHKFWPHPGGKDRPGWTLTHIPTGLAVCDGIDKDLLIWLAQEVSKLGSWEVYDPRSQLDTNQAKELVRNWVEPRMRHKDCSGIVVYGNKTYKYERRNGGSEAARSLICLLCGAEILGDTEMEPLADKDSKEDKV